MTYPNPLIFGRGLKTCIAISLCCYIVLLGVIEFTHDHAEHCHLGDACHSEDTCAACLFSYQHVSVEIEPSLLISLFLFSTILPFYEAVFLPLRLTTNTRSRAPPLFSNKPANFAIYRRIFVFPLYSYCTKTAGFSIRAPRFVHFSLATDSSVL